MTKSSVGLVGARGYVGSELLELIERHPGLDLAYASSRQFEGEPIGSHSNASFGGGRFENLSVEEVGQRHADIVILAVPDATTAAFVDSIQAGPNQPRLIVDLSADHRFNDSWVYGLPERNNGAISHASRIANPGCYATAAQLALLPIAPLLAQAPHCFGVSGYSGAGSTPSARNSTEALSNGVLPYKLTNHTHEREITRQMGLESGLGIRFSPHIASFFRGITMTVQATLTHETDVEALCGLYSGFYAGSSLIGFTAERVPEIREIVGTDGATIGGLSVNPLRPNEIAVVCTLDNLRKGAATQAVQNINIALGFDELTGLRAQHAGQH